MISISFLEKMQQKVFFKQIIDNSYDEIFIADGEGIAIYCNDSFEKNYGVKREELIGRHVNYVLDNDYVDVLMFDDVIKEKKSITYKQKTKAGRTILNTSSPILDENGEVEYVVENCRDITENELLYNALNYTKSQLEKQKTVNSKQEGFKDNFKDFKSNAMLYVISKTDRFINKDVNILITGASGTGKTSLAKYIHKNSNRKNNKFVSINCTTIPESLMESELFGYMKGSFTGALNSGKKGLVEEAEGGTLFLDEIGDIPLNLQAKLLELVQEKQYTPIGATVKKSADIRIIVATNKNLRELVKKGEFREDLYYRLNVVQIEMPKLSDRKEDIAILIDYFINYFNNKYSLKVSIDEFTRECLLGYSWQGNVRECEYLIEYLVLNAQNGIINSNDLPKNILNEYLYDSEDIDVTLINDTLTTYKELMEDAESNIIKTFYKKHNSSYKLAKALNISQSTANRLIKKYCR